MVEVQLSSKEIAASKEDSTVIAIKGTTGLEVQPKLIKAKSTSILKINNFTVMHLINDMLMYKKSFKIEYRN